MMLAADALSASPGRRPVLSGIDLAVRAGEVVGVIGANGAGKSTLLRCLAGIIPPRGGRVTLGGRDLAAWDRRALGCALAYLPQDRTVHWPLSVRAVVALGRLPHHAASHSALDAVDERAIDDALRSMDVASLADRAVSELSGGERARVLVARALAQNASFLIADEPAAGLDPAHALALFETFADLARSGSRAVAVALHDLSLAARYCDRVVLLQNGRIVAHGPPRVVLTPQTLASAYGIRATVGEIEGVPVIVPHAPLP